MVKTLISSTLVTSTGPSLDESSPDGEEAVRIHRYRSEGQQNNQVRDIQLYRCYHPIPARAMFSPAHIPVCVPLGGSMQKEPSC